MTVTIGRRELLAALGGAALAWPLAAQAQQQLNPVVGFLSGRSPVEALGVVAAFRKGLSESGFVEPQNVTIDFRWAARSERRPGDQAILRKTPTENSPSAEPVSQAPCGTSHVGTCRGAPPVRGA